MHSADCGSSLRNRSCAFGSNPLAESFSIRSLNSELSLSGMRSIALWLTLPIRLSNLILATSDGEGSQLFKICPPYW